MPVPIVLFSDAITAPSGLARITRDLATRIHSNLSDDFKICTLGYGAPPSAKFPFPQYPWAKNDYFIPFELPHISQDFCAGGPFILFTIGDIQRFLALADTQFCPDQNWAEWWKSQRAHGSKLWGYFPIDAHGVNGKLPPQLAHTLTHYDRVLVPSQWAAEIVKKTLPDLEVTVIPHGIDTTVFHPRDKWDSREHIEEVMAPVLQWPKVPVDVHPDALWIGIVATNQWRKDWGLGMEVVAEIAKSRPIFLWAHADRMKTEHWSLLELLSEFNLLQSSMLTVGTVPDESMAIAYSAMDLTLGIGRGEGFGYPIFESIFCGTPCFVSEYGASAEYFSSTHSIPFDLLRIEGHLNLLRPIHSCKHWMPYLNGHLNVKLQCPEELAWDRVWPLFSQWFKEGL